MLNVKNLLFIGLLAATGCPALAQQTARPAMTAAELKRNFALIEESTEEEGGTIDKLEGATVRGLVTYLKTHDVSAAQAKYLGLDYLDSGGAAHLKVFTYSFSSSGSRGMVCKPVMQWQNATGQRFAYAVREEWGFEKMYKLTSPGRTQYLLLGGQQADGRCFGSQAYVVELKGNYLLLNNAAFGKRPSLALCNVELTFEPGRQVLYLDLSEDSDLTAYSADKEDNALVQMGYPALPKSKRLTLQFSHGRFARGN